MTQAEGGGVAVEGSVADEGGVTDEGGRPVDGSRAVDGGVAVDGGMADQRSVADDRGRADDWCMAKVGGGMQGVQLPEASVGPTVESQGQTQVHASLSLLRGLGWCGQGKGGQGSNYLQTHYIL